MIATFRPCFPDAPRRPITPGPFVTVVLGSLRVTGDASEVAGVFKSHGEMYEGTSEACLGKMYHFDMLWTGR